MASNTAQSHRLLEYFALLIITLAVIIGFSPDRAASAECIDPIALWKLNEDGPEPVFQDAVNLGHNYGNCRQENGASVCPQSEPGRYDNAQKFYTNGVRTGIDVPAGPVFDWQNNANFSIAFWMKRDDTPFEMNEVIIGRDSQETDNDLHWWIGVQENGTAKAVLIDSSMVPTGGSMYLRGDKLLTDNAWHYVVFVRDGVASENRLYVDGVLEDKRKFTYDAPDAFVAPSTDINIGWLNLSPKFYHYKGVIDDLAVYDKALPQWFIRDRYHADERYGSAAPCE